MAERRFKSRFERVEFRECSNWIKETEGKAASRQGRREETRNRRMALTKCDIHFSPSIIRFVVGDSQKNNEDRVILSTSIMLSKTSLISSSRKKMLANLVKKIFYILKSRLLFSSPVHIHTQ